MMNKRVLILHGLGGSDYPHWQSCLAADLIKQNATVSFPSFQNRDNPQLEQWKENLKKEINHFNPDIVICHSLANVLWFHTCDELDIELEKLMLVAPVSRNRVVEAAKTFYPYPIAKELKAKTVAEYIHNKEVYDIVSRLGADFLQGFYLAEPHPLKEVN